MAKRYPKLDDNHIAFIKRQKLFFVATAAAHGRVNISPKGMDTLRVLDRDRLVWLNLTGSGNETAAHLLDDRRMTLLFCSFELEPLILRVYGEAGTCHPRDQEWPSLTGQFPPYPGARQVFELRIDLVQTSCGFAVPLFDYVGDRGTLEAWANKRGEEGIRRYWDEKNSLSLDGRPTGIVEDPGF